MKVTQALVLAVMAFQAQAFLDSSYQSTTDTTTQTGGSGGSSSSSQSGGNGGSGSSSVSTHPEFIDLLGLGPSPGALSQDIHIPLSFLPRHMLTLMNLI